MRWRRSENRAAAIHDVRPSTAPARHASTSSGPSFPRRPLPEVRWTTGTEHRWLFPRYGPVKTLERAIDELASEYIYPHVFGIWSPYSWQLPRSLVVTEGQVAPPRWPKDPPPLRVLHLSDIHTGPFLRASVLASVLAELMRLEPELVAITGDIVTGWASDLDAHLDGLRALAAAPLGAFFCFGNHDYFSSESDGVRERLSRIGIRTLRNESVLVAHRGATFRIGGIDDRVLGEPDWGLLDANGAPHLLLAHHPDDFYEAASRGVALVLSGHTHGGQIRLPNGRLWIRQSRFRLDEGLYAHGECRLVVSRGIGAVGLPWRFGADPEALLLTVGA
jgi:hypothetical protein